MDLFWPRIPTSLNSFAGFSQNFSLHGYWERVNNSMQMIFRNQLSRLSFIISFILGLENVGKLYRSKKTYQRFRFSIQLSVVALWLAYLISLYEHQSCKNKFHQLPVNQVSVDLFLRQKLLMIDSSIRYNKYLLTTSNTSVIPNSLKEITRRCFLS